MTVTINGAPVQLDGSPTVVDAISAAGHDGPMFGIAVALNGEVVLRSLWSETQLCDGDRVEVLVAAQGG